MSPLRKVILCKILLKSSILINRPVLVIAST